MNIQSGTFQPCGIVLAGHAGTNKIVSEMMAKSIQKYMNEHKYRREKPAAGLAGVEGVLALQVPFQEDREQGVGSRNGGRI